MHRNVHLSYRPDIDGLRGLCILSVVIYHAFPKVLPGGFVGVDVFFVISGYLISSIIIRSIRRDGFSLVEFYGNRVRRIFPALVLVLTSSFLVGWMYLTPAEFKSLGAQIFSSAFFYQNIYLVRTSGYFDSSGETKPVLHLWSLGVEEQFYLIYPFMLWLFVKLRIPFIYGIVSVASLSFFNNLYYVDLMPEKAFYLPQSRFWELLMGGVVACLPRLGGDVDRLPVSSNRGPVRVLFGFLVARNLMLLGSLVSLIAIIAGFFVINSKMTFPGWVSVLPVMSSCFLILFGGGLSNRLLLLDNRFLISLGLISYPLYLWHWPLLVFSRIIKNDSLTSCEAGFVVFSAVVLSAVTYVILERPARRAGNSKLLIYLLVLSLVLVGFAGYAAKRNRGFPERFPEIVSKLTDYSFGYTDLYRSGRCLIGKDQTYLDFDRECFASRGAGARRILLWGDSYAAHLYPGLMSVIGSGVKVDQLTSNACAPILGTYNDRRPNCQSTNDFVYSLIVGGGYDVVIIAANWEGYPDFSGLGSTLAKVVDSGVADIVLFGPPPHWKNTLPRELFNYFMNHRNQPIPERLSSGLSELSGGIDERLSSVAEASGVRYVSILNLLCVESGCLARVGDTADDLISGDNGHLTKAGSKALFGYIRDKGAVPIIF